VSFGYYVLAQQKTQAGSLCGRIGGKKRLQDFILIFSGMPIPLSLTWISYLTILANTNQERKNEI